LNTEFVLRYEEMPVDNFQSLDFSSHWNVKIKQGAKCRVELASGSVTNLTPKLENRGGTLYFSFDKTTDSIDDVNLHARVTVPLLKTLRAVQGSNISIENFMTDSLNVNLEDGVVFKGKNNHFDYLTIKTTGGSAMEFRDNTDF
jgi:hypothetical protein